MQRKSKIVAHQSGERSVLQTQITSEMHQGELALLMRFHLDLAPVAIAVAF